MNKHRVLRAIAILVPVIVLTLFAAGAIILRSVAFQRYALHKIEQSVADSTGARLQVRGLSVKWIPLVIELTGITARAENFAADASAANAEPLLSVYSLQDSLELWGLLHHQVRIRNVVIEGPTLFLHTGKGGRN